MSRKKKKHMQSSIAFVLMLLLCAGAWYSGIFSLYARQPDDSNRVHREVVDGCVVVTNYATSFEPRERKTTYCPKGRGVTQLRNIASWGEPESVTRNAEAFCTWQSFEKSWSCKSGYRFPCTDTHCTISAPW